MSPDHGEIVGWRWLGDLPGPVAVTYEAGPTGIGLARALTAAGIVCEVAAPSTARHRVCITCRRDHQAQTREASRHPIQRGVVWSLR